MLTIQLKVERETANPIKAMKRIDLGLRTDTPAQAAPPFSRGGRRARTWPELAFLRTFSFSGGRGASVARTNVTDLKCSFLILILFRKLTVVPTCWLIPMMLTAKSGEDAFASLVSAAAVVASPSAASFFRSRSCG